MDFKRSLSLALVSLLVAGCADRNLKADAPEDYKDQVKFGYGSLIKDKDSVLRKYFDKSSKESEISAEKVSASSRKDGMWNSVIVALKDFPIEFMDKKSGRIETESVKVKFFDSTESCTYKISVTVLSETNVDVVVTSAEDSSIRLKNNQIKNFGSV